MELFSSPVSYKTSLLIPELNAIGFFDLRINKINIHVGDAVTIDRASIQAVLDNHDSNNLPPREVAQADLLAVDLNAVLNANAVESAVKNIIIVLRTNGLLK